MKRMLPPAWLVLLPALLTGGAAEAHAQLASASTASGDDSVRAHRAARSRQAAFERTRRNNLPWAWGGGSGHCDERIGRFCLTYGDEDAEEWQPPEEPAAIVRARERLLDELSLAAEVVPGDSWVVGQQVRYLLEAERFQDARAAAAACRAEGWWCEALGAFADHHAGDAAAADAGFSRTLAVMPEEVRREWTDLRHILDDRSLRLYRDLSGADRTDFESRFWRLADPLLGIPGNHLRSEHLSRNVLVHLQDRAETTENLAWGDDLREILIRWGWPSGWERVRSSVPHLSAESTALVTHYPDSDLDLLPPADLLGESFDPAAGIWDDDRGRARTSYPLPFRGERLRWFQPFEHQVAVFRGGDSALIVAAYDLPRDSLPDGEPVTATLAALTDPASMPLMATRAAAGTRAVLTLAAPHAPLLVSLEAVAREARWAGRARFGATVPPLIPGVLAASDLLILQGAGDSLPESRADAIALARGSLKVRPGERVGVYWELYGLALRLPEPLEVSLRLVDADAGWLRRMAERIGLLQEVQPIRLVWGDAAGADEIIHRSLAVRIPPDISPGSYTLELTISAPGREPLVSRRSLQVIP